jgi:hypothetical protein
MDFKGHIIDVSASLILENEYVPDQQSVRTAGDFAWSKDQWREAAVRQITAERL